MPNPGLGNAIALNLRLAFYPRTDLGNAERFRERNRDRFRWSAIGWLWRDGNRWTRAGADERVKIAVHETVRAIQDEAKALVEHGYDVPLGKTGRRIRTLMLSEADVKWGRQSESAARLPVIAKCAAPYFIIRPEELDADLTASIFANRSRRGLRRRLAAPSTEATSVPVATDRYTLSDLLSRFISARLKCAPGERLRSTILYGKFREWCRENGVKEWPHVSLTGALKDRKFKTKKSSIIYFLDVQLVEKSPTLSMRADRGPLLGGKLRKRRRQAAASKW